MVNLHAMDYDDLKLISQLPKSSELYKIKVKQYSDLTKMRTEIEKVLQEQRLEKIRRDFEIQKYEEEKRNMHEKWLDE